MKRVICLITAFITALVFCACGASDYSYNGQASTEESKFESDSMSPEMPSNEAAEPMGADRQEVSDQRKVIKNYSADLQTLEFDETLDKLEEMTKNSGGYIESSSVSGSGAVDYGTVYPRYASYTLRVPSDKAGDMVAAFSQIAAVTNSAQWEDDVTDYYYDTEAHLTALRAQETRLLELLEQADSVDAMITIENALSDVRYQIESLDGTIRRLDSQIDYSSVTVSISEVFDPADIQSSPQTLPQRIASRFKSSIASFRGDCEDFVVFLLGDIIYIILWGVIIFFVVKIYKYTRRNMLKKHKDRESDEK